MKHISNVIFVTDTSVTSAGEKKIQFMCASISIVVIVRLLRPLIICVSCQSVPGNNWKKQDVSSLTLNVTFPPNITTPFVQWQFIQLVRARHRWYVLKTFWKLQLYWRNQGWRVFLYSGNVRERTCWVSILVGRRRRKKLGFQKRDVRVVHFWRENSKRSVLKVLGKYENALWLLPLDRKYDSCGL